MSSKSRLRKYSVIKEPVENISQPEVIVDADPFEVEQMPFPEVSNPLLPVVILDPQESDPLLPTVTPVPQESNPLLTAVKLVPQDQSACTGPIPTAFIGPDVTPAITEQFVTSTHSPQETGPIQLQLQLRQTGQMAVLDTGTTTSLRTPVLIPGSQKRSVAALQSSLKLRRKRTGVHLTVATLLVTIVIGSLLAVLPLGNDGRAAIGLRIFQPQTGYTMGKSNSTGLLDAQAATATAVTQDGYDAGANTNYAGVKKVTLPGAGSSSGSTSAPASGGNAPSSAGSGAIAGSGDTFAAGQCTYWASYRYHQMAGYWVPWHGNANQWYGGALSSGWIASATPRVPSIIVLQAGVQGASWGYGHVAVVESINADGSVVTSNWNWAGNWGRTTYVTFHPGGGVSFVYHP